MPGQSRSQINRKYGLHLAFLESLFCLLEFVFGLVTANQLCSWIVSTVGLNEQDSELVRSAAALVANALVVAWMSFRMAHSVQLSTREFLGRLLAPPWLSRVGALLVVLHAAGFVGLLAAQYYLGRWIFSINNYVAAEGGYFALSQALEMLLFSPFREEIVFRAAMFCIFYRRTGDGGRMTGVAGKQQQFKCVVACSCVFGAIHMLNLFSKDYSSAYIAMQVSLGFLIGMLYGFRFVLNSSIREGIILHITNNLFSSFLPLEMHVSLSDPLLMLPLLQTIVVYSVINYKLYHSLLTSTSEFTVLKPMTHVMTNMDTAIHDNDKQQTEEGLESKKDS